MRDQWYGDARDLVKWSVLLCLAKSHSAKRILQVAYFRESTWGKLEIDGQEHPVSRLVVNHFRNILNIQDLTSEPQIQVLGSVFKDRDQYNQAVVAKVVEGRHPCIVFLDPDTGLERPSGPKPAHVLESELKYIWSQMPTGDVLVFYQHRTNMNGQPWIEPKRSQFEKALRLPRGGAKLALGPKIAADVAFYYCRKETG